MNLNKINFFRYLINKYAAFKFLTIFPYVYIRLYLMFMMIKSYAVRNKREVNVKYKVSITINMAY